MSRSIVFNDLEKVQKRRAARIPSRKASRGIKGIMGIFCFLLLFAMIHLQIQTHISQESRSLASSQEEYFRLQNVERDLTQQVAGLKGPARIRRLALSIGMVPPQDQRFAQVYSAPWATEIKPASDVRRADATSGSEKLSLWAKLLPFSSQAEAKTTEE